jgi:hypothetical protein
MIGLFAIVIIHPVKAGIKHLVNGWVIIFLICKTWEDMHELQLVQQT